ncbi:MAG: hypothetical protein IKP23_00595 [Elusimicrobiaceae bacterium]|nr:hypothetical protein [Elusimicrobiaceae bacterium]
MVENNKDSTKQESPQVLNQVENQKGTEQTSSTEPKPRSVWVTVGIIFLIIIGIVIAIPFLFFITCLGLVSL